MIDGTITKDNEHYIEWYKKGHLDMENRAWKDISPTLNTNQQAKVLLGNGGGCKLVNTNINNLRIRKLTPKECFRLMGFDDEDYENAAKENSPNQLYKQAGNSIVVSCLEYIFKNMFEDVEHKQGEVKQERLFL